MIKPRLVGLLLGVCVTGLGCIDSETALSIRKDGSGTVTETVYSIRSVERMMLMLHNIAMALDSTGPASSGVGLGATRQDCLDRSAMMGTGVTLQSYERVDRRDGANGVKAVYAFEDVRDLSLSVSPNYPPPVRPESSSTNAPDSMFVTFGFTREGDDAGLTVNIPWAETAAVSAARHAASPVRGSLSLEEITMYRHVLDGFRIRLVVIPETPIKETDAAMVEAVRRDAEVKRIVLCNLVLGEAARNDSVLEMLAGLGPAKTVPEVLEKYAGVPGLDMELKEHVTIRF